MAAVRLTVAARPASVGTCDLCTVGPTELADAVLIQHATGAAVTFAVCGRCAQAARRIAAVVGHDGDWIEASGAASPRGVAPTSHQPRAVPGPSELMHEYADQLFDANGTPYVIRAYGQARTDGTWVGWLRFEEVGATTGLQTDIETTQPDRGAVAYWASGLEPTYLEGAFARARRAAAR